MKKVLIAAAALVASAMPVMAEEDFAPAKGDLSLEVQFNPFSNNFTTFKIDRLQATYMLTDKDGVRVGLGLSAKSHKVTPSEENTSMNAKYNMGHFDINLGYERHFFNYKRIDLYAGAEVTYTHRWAGSTVQDKENDYKGETINVAYGSIDTNGNFSDLQGRAGNDFEFNLFTGINFSVYKGLYVGAEIALGANVENDSWIKTKQTINGITNETKGSDKTSTFNCAFKATPALRLGWTF